MVDKDVVVLLTVYNRPSVRNTIDSVLNQTFEDFELLIIDNASDDGTYEILQDYARRDARITIVRNEKNMGQTYSLHKGMEIASARYIARIDADDLMKKDRLKKQYEFMEKNPEYGFCGSWVQLITDDDRLAMVIRMPTTDRGLKTCQKVSCGVYHPAVMMRKSVLDEYKIMYDPDLKMAEDYDMWRQMLRFSKGLNIPEVLLYYRRGDHNDSIVHRKTTFREENIVRHKICGEGFYPGKKYMEQILEIERKDTISILNTLKALALYMCFLNCSLKKEDPDYGIVKKRIRSRMIGTYTLNNRAGWAKCVYWFYSVMRKVRYRLLK